MNFLFVVDRAPLPARDGVTIPMVGVLSILKRIGSVTILIVGDLGDGWREVLDEQKRLCNSSAVHYLKRTKESVFKAAFSEMFLGKPFFHCWQYDVSPNSLDLGVVDFVVASPINVLDVAVVLKRKFNAPLFSFISDVFTSFLRAAPVRGSPRSVCRGLVMRLRGQWFASIERRVLAESDRVFVQTERDISWLKVVGGEELVRRGVALSNGVDSSLFAGERSLPLPNVIFLASFTDPHYREMLRWVLVAIWPKVKASVPSATLRIVGRGVDGDEKLVRLIACGEGVEYLGFVEKLSDAYRDVRLSIAPIFKKYGFINKVAESLAVGIPVIGDISAFNGLEKYSRFFPGLCCRTADEFVSSLIRYLTDDSLWGKASSQATAFAKDELTWDAKGKQFLQVYKDFNESRNAIWLSRAQEPWR